ncbi:protocatechuate 3,4-dioxygenase subunit alpha [Kribbella antibiotica]|uniref:Protocatechuate 3,4-dioxygenase subunit alpha n=1 Tax=Kribbella antibiotica TaxID=190195 RepID=A0A4R4YME4_9ACTN|nr:protocatechuate 3,4-dioxygenase subunit alpha [Kribbella antibiotica]TDD44662.1 protocatechuate 3,4-dioxygenase subunit alpha [Kribbella antibiotica]
MPERTPGQTVGPFFHYALPYDGDRELMPVGTGIRLHGIVYDGAGEPVPDALLEIRQADAAGVVPQVPGSLLRNGVFTGWGRSSTDLAGEYWFSTVEPGSVDGGAPFFAVTVFARGLLDRLFTRIYLPNPPADRLLASLDHEDQARMIATREKDGSLRFDLHLQGDNQSIFLTYPGHQ